MNSLRRYEILLPLLFNDGTPVPEALLVETFRDESLKKRTSERLRVFG